jgi:hypothetical protein
MSALPPQLESIRAKIGERRKSIEQMRSFNVRRIQTDMNKITKQEIEFTKKLFDQVVPIKLIWNDEATKRLREMLPFTLELTTNNDNKDKDTEEPSNVTLDDV